DPRRSEAHRADPRHDGLSRQGVRIGARLAGGEAESHPEKRPAKPGARLGSVGHARETPLNFRALRIRAGSSAAMPLAIAGGRCSRNAAASVRNAARDFASDSVDSSTISDDGSAGRPNRRLTSMVPGGAIRHENTEVARPAETASATA